MLCIGLEAYATQCGVVGYVYVDLYRIYMAWLTLVVSLRADLHADGQVDDVQMRWSARQAAVLAGSGARLA